MDFLAIPFWCGIGGLWQLHSPSVWTAEAVSVSYCFITVPMHIPTDLLKGLARSIVLAWLCLARSHLQVQRSLSEAQMEDGRTPGSGKGNAVLLLMLRRNKNTEECSGTSLQRAHSSR